MAERKLGESSAAPPQNHQTVVGQSVVLRGELSGNEDLFLAGQFEGNIRLQDHCLTIGPEGQVKAEIRARQVIILGSVEGNVFAREKIEIRKTGHVVGDLLTTAITIEEGACFKGSINIVKEGLQEMLRPPPATHAPEGEPKKLEGFGTIRVNESAEITE